MIRTSIVHSFTDEPFKGNPAAVCFPEAPLSPATMLRVAQELGFSETAFLQASGARGAYSIRFFSPKMEIPLCGHATLAAGRVTMPGYLRTEVRFTTAEGLELIVREEDGWIVMDFPAYAVHPAEAPEALLDALGLRTVENAVFNAETQILMLEIKNLNTLASLAPDVDALIRSHDTINGVLVTAASGGDGFDFHSRYFWPWSGTDEDPVTGATHTFLAPYWAKRLGKTTMRSFQASERTGWMEVTVSDEGVRIRAHAMVVFEGYIAVSMP